MARESLAVGDTVTRKGYKTRARVVRLLSRPHAQNKWEGWVEVEPALGGYTRWHEGDLEHVAHTGRRSD